MWITQLKSHGSKATKLYMSYELIQVPIELIGYSI